MEGNATGSKKRAKLSESGKQSLPVKEYACLYEKQKPEMVERVVSLV